MTIYALASGRGKAGIAVIRLSGPRVSAAVEALTGKPAPEAGRVKLRAVRDPETGEEIDRGLVLFFKGPNSYTGEDVAEFHVHGGPAVVNRLLEAVGKIEGLRPAEGGEFTRRAFENSRLDLTRAEAIGDLVNAETEIQRRQALRQMEGALGDLYEGWRAAVMKDLAWIEAVIDFPEEEVPVEVPDQIWASLAKLRDGIEDGRDEQDDPVEVGEIGRAHV